MPSGRSWAAISYTPGRCSRYAHLQGRKGGSAGGVPPRVAEAIRRDVPVEREFAAEAGGLAVWLRALRVHQWLKNLLLFVPLLTAFSFFDAWKLVTTVIAFFAFSFAASASYVFQRPVGPRERPGAPAQALAPLREWPAYGSRKASPWPRSCSPWRSRWPTPSRGAFSTMLLLYLALTSAYSWLLKERALIDVLTLSLLYTLRILAGSVAIGIPSSSWQLAFSAFIFLSLALVKRCAELVSLEQSGQGSAPGRDYRVTDLAVLWPLGVGAALSAVVVFGLFISTDETRARYATPELLWLVALGLVYWLARLWIKDLARQDGRRPAGLRGEGFRQPHSRVVHGGGHADRAFLLRYPENPIGVTGESDEVQASRWLAALEKALSSPDRALLAPLFARDAHWRDLLASPGRSRL